MWSVLAEQEGLRLNVSIQLYLPAATCRCTFPEIELKCFDLGSHLEPCCLIGDLCSKRCFTVELRRRGPFVSEAPIHAWTVYTL